MTNCPFTSLDLPASMLDNLEQLGFKSMTAIQAHSLPSILDNKDVIAQAKTGSGKTVTFGIGVLNKLNAKQFRVQSLVICPTRELADQVTKELRRLARFTQNIKILTLCGGVPTGPQLNSLVHGAHIIVGTPGRILKHLKKESLCLSNLETLVLDEADKMLDMGFFEDIKQIIKYTPKNRQTLLFSATYPEEIIKLSASIQTNAINIKTTEQEEDNKVTEYFYDVLPGEKPYTLLKVINHYRPKNIIIFSNTKQEVKDIRSTLQRQGIDALVLHGDLEQYQRNDMLVKFSNESCAVLIATDVASRGIDIKDLAMVINYQLPHDKETYTHRIGRTARAGNQGLAVTFCSGLEARKAESYRNQSRHFISTDTLNEQDNFIIEAPNATLVIESGKKNKIRPGDILGALSGDIGIESKFIGKINVFDRQSYIAIQKNIIEKAHRGLKKGKIKGQKCTSWIL